MKKIAMYRRGRGCPNDGFKEKVTYQLSKRPMTGTELASILKMPLKDFNHIIRPEIRRTKVAAITASEWTTDSEGNRDRTYTLTAKPKRIAPKVTPAKTIVVSLKSFGMAGEEQRQKNIIAARKRATLIAQGIYKNHMG